MELLFDDDALDRTAGVVRVLGTVRKEPAPVLQAERPWEREGFLSMMSPLFDAEEGRFKLWYRAKCGVAAGTPAQGVESSERDPARRRVFLCYAESADGLHWERPDLGIVDFRGRRDNNILLELRDADSVFWNVVKDTFDPDPARRYKAAGFDDAPGGRGFCVAFSPDGLRWPEPPRLVMSTREVTDSDCILPRRDPDTGKWVAFLRPRTVPKRRFVGWSESADFERWTPPRMLLTPDATDDEWTEFYGLTAACLNGWRVGSLWVYRNNPDCSPMTSELVYSRDGRHYRRVLPRTQFLPLGGDGDFDSRMVWATAIIERGPELLIFYNGCNREHGSDRGMPMQDKHSDPGVRTGLGLARLPKHHLCGLRAEQGGMIETKWLCQYDAVGVTAFAEIALGGAIEVEVLDQYGKVIPGWDRSVSRLRPAPDGSWRCLWDGGLDAAYGRASATGGTIGHVIKLRFHLRDATLYGFHVGDVAGPR